MLFVLLLIAAFLVSVIFTQVIIDYPFLNLTANATCQLFYSFPER